MASAATPVQSAPLSLRGVGKRYGEGWALQPLDLDVERGKTLVLLGPSGCGKSTLLKLLLGLVSPDGGVVRFEGEPLQPERLAQVRHQVGYAVQGGGLFPHLTAARNVTLLARSLHWTQAQVQARLEELGALVQLDAAALQRFPGELSGGQAQRVGLMRALFLRPKALLLDEPLGALDPITRADLQDELRGIFQQLGLTVVLVTHDLAEAAHFADRVLLLRKGRVLQDGPYSALLHAPADPFVRRFVEAQRRGASPELGQ